MDHHPGFDRRTYERPTLRELGSLAELTRGGALPVADNGITASVI